MLSAFSPKVLPLSSRETRLSSPNGLLEEGVIEHLFSLLPVEKRFCVEIGAGDGTNFSLTRRLIQEKHWAALLIEASPELSQKLTEKHQSRPDVQIVPRPIDPYEITQVFAQHQVPTELDLLCIDIDSLDYYVWENLTAYRPSVVLIEYNASYPPPREFVVPYQKGFYWQGDDYFGASFQSLLKLALTKQYSLVHVMSHGDNLVFVRNDFLRYLPFQLPPAESMYQIPQFGRYGRCRNGKGHPASRRDTNAAQRAWYRLNYFLMTPLRRMAEGRK